MTTNIERAEEIMSEWAEVKRFAPDIAQQLASANPPILMPDLPPADEGEWENFGNVISLDGMHILPMIENDALTPDEARDIAYSLLAAADYAEQEQGNDGEKKYTVRYYNPIMGVYETHWDTQEEAEKEAAYDHGMNGAPTRVLDPDGNEIATFEEGQRHV